MKAALLTRIRQIEIGEMPEPEITRPDDVIVRIDAVGVCGSDIHYYSKGGIGSQRVEYPQTAGHECAGTVVQIPAGMTGLKEGQRVAIDPLIPCGKCDQCLNGRVNTCRNQKFMGCPGEAPGALSERLAVPAKCCYPIPDSMGMAQAAMVEPFSIGLYAVRMAGIAVGAKVAILGTGPIGLCVLLACLAQTRCEVYATDLLNNRLALARKCGAAWTGNPREENIAEGIIRRVPPGVDFVFECAGEQETLDEAVEILKPGGTLLIAGIPETDRVSLFIHRLRRKEITIRNVRRQNEATEVAIELISRGRVCVDPLLTHHFPFAETRKAFELVSDYQDGVVKAIIHVSG